VSNSGTANPANTHSGLKGPNVHVDLRPAANKDFYDPKIEALPHPQSISGDINRKLAAEESFIPNNSLFTNQAEKSENPIKNMEAANEDDSQKMNARSIKFLNYMQLISTLGTGSSVLANLLSLSEKTRKLSDKLSQLSSKSFIFVNSVIGSFRQLKRKNVLAASGYIWDILVSLFVPMRVAFLARGPASGLTQLGHSLSRMTGKEVFATYKEHLEHLKEGFSKGFKMLREIRLKEILYDKKSPFLLFVGGITGTLGTIIWGLTKNEKLGTFIRDFGGGTLDVGQVLPQNFGKPYYMASGWSYLAGTFADYYTKYGNSNSKLAQAIPNIKKAAESFSFFADNIGKFLLSKSEHLKENSQ
jgi:hypothetical protein